MSKCNHYGHENIELCSGIFEIPNWLWQEFWKNYNFPICVLFRIKNFGVVEMLTPDPMHLHLFSSPCVNLYFAICHFSKRGFNGHKLPISSAWKFYLWYIWSYTIINKWKIQNILALKFEHFPLSLYRALCLKYWSKNCHDYQTLLNKYRVL